MAVIPMFVDASAILVSDVVGKEVFGRDRQVLDRLLKELSSKESSFTEKGAEDQLVDFSGNHRPLSIP